MRPVTFGPGIFSNAEGNVSEKPESAVNLPEARRTYGGAARADPQKFVPVPQVLAPVFLERASIPAAPY